MWGGCITLHVLCGLRLHHGGHDPEQQQGPDYSSNEYLSQFTLGVTLAVLALVNPNRAAGARLVRALQRLGKCLAKRRC